MTSDHGGPQLIAGDHDPELAAVLEAGRTLGIPGGAEAVHMFRQLA